MKFLIIDNQGGQLDSLILALRKAFPGTEILPAPGATTKAWSDAEELLIAHAQNDPGQIIFVDLALDSDDPADAFAGLVRVRQLFDRRPSAIWIAFTSFNEVVELGETKHLFAGILNKQQWSRYRTPEDRAAFVGRVVAAALRQRGQAKESNFTTEDSLGMRTFFAAFPDPTLDELIALECANWTAVSVRALSAGYSGSSLLSISGQKGGAPHHIVVKLASRAELIERETHVLDDEFFGQVNEFSAKCARAKPVKDLPNRLGFYSLQEAIAGSTLGSLFIENDATADAEVKLSAERRASAIEAVIDFELNWCNRAWREPAEESDRKLRRFNLTAADIYRAQKSCNELTDMGELIAEGNGWPEGPSPRVLFERINNVVTRWRDLILSTKPFFWVLQHGDLNPHNVMVGYKATDFVFIDLARVDNWPAGYDLCRLAIQLRIRMVDRKRGADWIENRLATWCSEPFLTLDTATNWEKSQCIPASRCEQAFLQWITSKGTDPDVFIEGARIGALYDLLRVMSYVDLSPFKRLWACRACWDLIELVGWTFA